MALISSLFVKLSADSAQLTKEFDKTRKQSKSWSQSVSSNLKYAAAGFAGLGVAGGFAAKRIYDTQAPVIDRLGKLSDTVDVSVGRLQSYRHASELAGISTQALDSSMLRFNRRLGKAAEGGGAAAKALKQLGFDAKELSDKGTDAAFTEVLDKLKGMEDQAIANGIAFDIFGDSASEIMRLSSDQINSANTELDKFGALLNRVDAAKVEAANDAMFKIDVATNAVSQRLAVDMAPLLQATSELFLENALQSGVFRDIGSKAVDIVAKAIGWMGDRLQDVRTGFVALGTGATFAGLKIVQALEFVGITSQETVKEWQGYYGEAFLDLEAAANATNFSEVLAGKMAAANEQAEELAKSVNKIGKGPALALAGVSLSGSAGQSDSGSTGSTTDPAANDQSFYDSQIIAFQDYKQSLQDGYAEISDSFRFHYDNRYQILNEALQREAITQSEYDAQFHNVRLENERKSASAIQSVRSSLTDNLIGLLQGLGNKQKIFAKLAVALEAKRSLAENWQKTSVAAIQAYSSQLIPGDPTSFGRAAGAYTKTMTLGKVNAALILANAALDAGSSGGSSAAGGGTISGGSSDVGSQTQNATQSASVTDSAAGAQSGSIYVLYSGSGELTSDDNDKIREQIRELTDTGALKVSGSDIDDMRIEVV